MNRCTVFSAGPSDCRWIPLIQDLGYVIAADGGYHLAEAHGVAPQLVVGDFDSAAKPENYKVISFPKEKDDTDTGLAVRHGLSKGCREFLFFGCTGGMLDHTISNISTVASLCAYQAEGWILDDRQAITCRRDSKLTFCCDIGTRFSVFPWGGPCEVSYEGAKYPLNHFWLREDHPLGVSNESTEKKVTIEIHEGTALVIVTGITNTFVNDVYNKV